MANKRVIDLSEKQTLDNTDFVLVDSSSTGSKKYNLSNLKLTFVDSQGNGNIEIINEQ